MHASGACPPGWSRTTRTAALQRRPHRDRSPTASTDPVPTTTRTRRDPRWWPSTSGPHDCAGPCRRATPRTGRQSSNSTDHASASASRCSPDVASTQAISNSSTGGDDAPPRTTLRLGTGTQSARHSGPTSSESAIYVRTPQPLPRTTPGHRNIPGQNNHPVRSARTLRSQGWQTCGAQGRCGLRTRELSGSSVRNRPHDRRGCRRPGCIAKTDDAGCGRRVVPEQQRPGCRPRSPWDRRWVPSCAEVAHQRGPGA